MTAKIDALIRAVMPAFAPPPDLTVGEWAEANRRLPASSPAAGACWRNRAAPYLLEPLNACADPAVRTLVIVGASQVGKSEVVTTAIGYWIATDPSNVLVVYPSFEDARHRSRGALADMLRTTPVVSDVVRGHRASRGAHESQSTTLEKLYPGGSLVLAGSGTPNSFAGISARRVIADEFERFQALDEGDAAILLANRVSAFYDGLVVFVSSPLLVDGAIDRQFRRTDQRRYFLVCPDCGRANFTTWNAASTLRVVFENRDATTARLECPDCGARHDEPARRRMIAAGSWRPTATPTDPTARGYHLPATISMLGDVSLERLVRRWLTARESGPAALMAFLNTIAAEPWEDRGGKIAPHTLVARLEDYGPGIDVPAGACCLTCGIDVQVNRLEVVVLGWGVGAECWVVDAHQVPGDPTRPEVREALLAALAEPYRHASGASLPILATAIDAGFLPDRVAYDVAARRPRSCYAVKGIGGRFGEPSLLKVDLAKPPVTINVDALKLETHLGLELAGPGAGYMHLSHSVCDESFISQLLAEHRETRRRNGAAKLVWVEDRAENHALDCCVYGRAALKILARVSGARNEISFLAMLAARRKGTTHER